MGATGTIADAMGAVGADRDEITFPIVFMAITNMDAFHEIVELMKERGVDFKTISGAPAMNVFSGWW
jgi:hypothetical protein